eukprot:5924814-Pleurochrysis_carterae.AAC.1
MLVNNAWTMFIAMLEQRLKAGVDKERCAHDRGDACANALTAGKEAQQHWITWRDFGARSIPKQTLSTDDLLP